MTEYQLQACVCLHSGHLSLHVPAYNTTIFHNFYDTDREARLNFEKCFLHRVNAGEVDIVHTHSRRDEAQFYLIE